MSASSSRKLLPHDFAPANDAPWLMVSLRGLGRGSVLYMHGRAEPVLAVPVVSRRRSMALLVVQDPGGWSYLWDAAHRTPARSAPVAAELIAGVTW
jgi:hypothetical protein